MGFTPKSSGPTYTALPTLLTAQVPFHWPPPFEQHDASRPPHAVLPQVVYHNLSGLTPVCTHRHLPKFKSLFKVRPANAFQCFQTQNKLFGKVFKVWMAWPLLPFQVWNVISVHQLRNLLITFAITLTYNYKWLASNSVHFPMTLNWRDIVTIQITNLYN